MAATTPAAESAVVLSRLRKEFPGTPPVVAVDDIDLEISDGEFFSMLGPSGSANVGEYWSDYLKEIQAFKNGSSTVGTTWQVIANLAQAEKAPVQVVLPKEGATGWSDTWMVGAKSQHKTCAYKFIDHIVSPKTNAAVAEYFGEAPANKKACAETADKNQCTTFHAADEKYFSKVHYWTTPISACLDGRTDVQCTDYAQWTKAWTEVRNS